MKITGTFLIIASGAAAFTQAPKPFAAKGATESSTAVFSSYLSNMNSSVGGTVQAPMRRNEPMRTPTPFRQMGGPMTSTVSRRSNEEMVSIDYR